MVIKRRRLKKRNLALIIIAFILIILLIIDIAYTKWLFQGGLLVESSPEVKKCLKNHHLLLTDCLYSLNDDNLVKQSDESVHFVGEDPNNYLDLGDKYDKAIYQGINKTNELDVIYYTDISECLKTNRKCSLYHKENDPILWRIVGLYKINDLYYPKVILNDAIGEFSWDSSDVEINNGMGINKWEESDLFNLLNNGAFYNKEEGHCIIDKENKETQCNFSSIGLSENLKNYIFPTSWYLGSIDNLNNYPSWLEQEKGLVNLTCESGEYCNDEVERNPLVDSSVGLLSPSDLLLASPNPSCLETSSLEECQTNNYLMNNKNKMWLLNPYNEKYSKASVLTYSSKSGFSSTFASVKALVYPTLYLNRELKIAGGFGTKENPYIIKI